jgi:hypothetical protein
MACNLVASLPSMRGDVAGLNTRALYVLQGQNPHSSR